MIKKLSCVFVLLSLMFVPTGQVRARTFQLSGNNKEILQIKDTLEIQGGSQILGSAYSPLKSPSILAASGFAAIAAGENHTCALTASGGVKCWGYNYLGQLGDGTISLGNSIPVDVVGLSSGVTAISAGGNHTCAIISTGEVKCWGGVYPYLDDSTNGSTTPMTVIGLPADVFAIAAGYAHACALTATGGVKCWGTAYLGDGTTNSSSTPVDVVGLSSGVIAIAAGYYRTCVLTVIGGVKCWGGAYPYPDSTINNSTTPTDVVGLSSGVASITLGGSRVCALMSSGGVKCWEVGSVPVDVVGLPNDVVAITAGGSYSCQCMMTHSCYCYEGENHTCAITSTGGIKCWGDNEHGQLGDGTTNGSAFPLDVIGLSSDVIVISAGDSHTCALTSSGRGKCWGVNYFGQLGSGTALYYQVTPVSVVGLSSSVTAIAAGDAHTCALAIGGEVKCWGNNSTGQLGDGTINESNIPVDVVGLSSSVAAIAAGSGHTCALTSSGGVKCWGWNDAGQLGDGTTTFSRSKPIDVVGLASGVVAITAGFAHTCALTSSGGVKCWGRNWAGEVGDGTMEERVTPVDVIGLSSNVIAISAGGDHTCALTKSGGVKCWGSNLTGQIGSGETTYSSSTPVDVVGLSSGAIAIAAGYEHTCAITSSGEVECWGDNENGQLGDDTTNNSNVPLNVVGLASGVTAVATGGDYGSGHTCALTSSGRVKCWGSNEFGQLGNGTMIEQHTPVDVVGLSGSATAITTGGWHTCALTSTGGVKCWGDHSMGRLGDGVWGGYSAVPVSIMNPIFEDVPATHWAWDWIERLYSADITGGCGSGIYCPDNPVTRAQMSVFLERGLHYPALFDPTNVAPTFNDTVGHWAEDWIEALRNDGITAGCAEGLYCPEVTVMRAQAAVFLLKAKHGTSFTPPDATGVFTDVPLGYWADKWIEELAAEGITSGCAPDLFCPNDPVTRAQMAVFLVKMFNLP